jgi:hypothetical protein
MRILGGVSVMRLLLYVIVGCFVGNSIGSELSGKNTIQGTVLKVSPSLGFWTGITESLQWFDMKVVESRVPEIKRGVVLHIGVPVVQGNRLFDAQKPRFAEGKVAPGKLLELSISRKSSQARGPRQYVVEPTCVRVIK